MGLKEKEKYNVLVTVFNDGEENASIEYDLQAIKALIEDLRQKRWTFTYIGTDHDVDKMATAISINNVMVFERSEVAINNMFKTESAARMKFSSKISRDEETDSEFY